MKQRNFKSGYLATLSILALLGAGNLPVEARHDKATVEPTEVHMKDGLKKMKLKDYEGASDEFLQACYFARNKYLPQGWLNLGLCYKAVKNHPKAIEAFTTHLSQTTEKAMDAHIDLAECYMYVGEFDKAEKEITLARVDADYVNKRPFYAMGELQEKLEHPGEALDSFTTALGDKPWTYTEAWMGRARCEVKMKQWNSGLKDYKDIIDSAVKNVDWVELYFNMAMCLYKRGDHQGAIDHLLEALKTNSDHFDSHLALAHIFDEEKHITSAVNQYEHALRTASKTYDTKAINERILVLQAQLKSGERDKVVKPSPYMRQQDQQQQQQQQQQVQPGDSGF